MLLNKGSVPHKTIRVIGTRAHMFKTLKDRLLDELQLYSCSVSNFYLTDVPPIFAEDIDSAIRIFPKDDLGTAVINIDDPWGANQAPLNRVGFHTLDLKRNNLHSIPDLIMTINDFFTNFNEQIAIYGSTTGADNSAHLALPNDASDPNDQIDNVYPDDNILFSLDTTGRMVLKASDGFLSQFYIRLDTRFAKMVGFPEILYQSTTQGNVGTLVNHYTVDEPTPYELVAPGAYQFKFILKVATTALSTKFESTKSLYNFDTRLSIELHCSFHFSRTIHASETEYQEKFLLGEFPLSDYQNARNAITGVGDAIISRGVFTDFLEGGLTDLCARNPQSQIVHCLPGNVRTINTQINVCYRWDGKKIYKPFVFDLGRFDFTILFVRKIIKEQPNE